MALTSAVSFNFNKFGPDQKDLIFQGDATSNNKNNVLQLTKLDSGGNPVSSSVGRVLHVVPLRLWGSSTAVFSFETSFTFSISSSNDNPADGLAFFIAPLDSQIPSNGNGSNLGIYPSDKLVAVEFDTYPNRDKGDPDYQHVGINVNSIISKVTAKWDWQNGKIATAHISYNSVSKKLTTVTFYPGSQSVSLSYDIDLKTVLPEWVRVGFSAATGEHAQTNTILSWSFTSSFINN